MKLDEAKAEVMRLWSRAAERRKGVPVRVDDAAEEYPWGWVIYLVPQDPAAATRVYPRSRYAVARESGRSTPVGTKGLGEALEDLFGRT